MHWLLILGIMLMFPVLRWLAKLMILILGISIWMNHHP